MCRDELGLANFVLGRGATGMRAALPYAQAVRGAWPVHRLKAREKLLTSANPSK